MPDLSARLTAIITRDGPISVACYMQKVLTDPDFGYYQRTDPLGVAGDFITAPEISQVFGELLGAWCAIVWQQMGRPAPVQLIELGPGRGTLMADALRAIEKSAPPFRDSLFVHLVETSPVLQAKQAKSLAGAAPAWHARFEDVDEGPFLLIANEFFDALPVRQYQLSADGWRERLIETKGGRFCFTLSQKIEPAPVEGGSVGDIFETCDHGRALARKIGERLTKHGGAALVVDYGHERSAIGETLQAVRGHEYHDVLEMPGSADLTAHVDFAAIAREAKQTGAQARGPVPQGRFLSRLGIRERFEALARGATADVAVDLEASCRRLIGEREMGTLFKALALTSRHLPTPPGFE